MFLLVLSYRLCKQVRLGILEMSLYVIVCVVVQGIYICKTGNIDYDRFSKLCTGFVLMIDRASGNEPLCVMFVLLYWVCTHLILCDLAMILCGYVCVVLECFYTCKLDILETSIFCLFVCVLVEGMYIFRTRIFGDKSLCLCLCCC